MLEKRGAPEGIVEVRSGFGGEDITLLRVETHSPPGCPFLEADLERSGPPDRAGSYP